MIRVSEVPIRIVKGKIKYKGKKAFLWISIFLDPLHFQRASRTWTLFSPISHLPNSAIFYNGGAEFAWT
jgi:hypothetical protein